MDKGQAAQELRKFVNFFQALSGVADQLDRIQSVEEAQANVQRMLDATNAKIADAGEKLEQMSSATLAAQEEAETLTAQAKANAESIINAASESANAILSKADEDAKASAQGVLDSFAAQIQAANEELESAKASAESLVSTVNDLEIRKAELERQVYDAQSTLAGIKEQAGKLLG